MDLSGLRRNVSPHERCPYCHDALGEAERIECSSCGTPHHPVCLEELGGCTVLGCGAKPPKAPTGPTEELRARIRDRVARYRAGLQLPQDDERVQRRVQRRLANQPPFCVACERELRVRDCPVCEERVLLLRCEGDSVHCMNDSCKGFYTKLAKTRGAPIERRGKRQRPALLIPLGLVGLLLLGSLSVLLALAGGPASTPFVLVAVGAGAALFLFGPLIVMMIAANKRED